MGLGIRMGVSLVDLLFEYKIIIIKVQTNTDTESQYRAPFQFPPMNG